MSDKLKQIRCKLKNYKPINSEFEKMELHFFTFIKMFIAIIGGICMGFNIYSKEYMTMFIVIVNLIIFIKTCIYRESAVGTRLEFMENWNRLDSKYKEDKYVNITYNAEENSVKIFFDKSQDEEDGFIYVMNDVCIEQFDGDESELDVADGILYLAKGSES